MNRSRVARGVSYAALVLALGTSAACSDGKKVVDDNPDGSQGLGAHTLTCAELEAGMTLTNRNDSVDYIVDCFARIRGTLTVEGGVVVEFEEDAALDFLDSGTLDARGTPTNGVVFRGRSTGSRNFIGLRFTRGSGPHVLDNVTVAGGGIASFDSNDERGNIVLQGSDLTIRGSFVNRSSSYGLHVLAGSTLTIEATEFDGNALAPLSIPPGLLHVLDNTNTFRNNAEAFIRVPTQTTDISQLTARWNRLDLPYRVVASGGSRLGLGEEAHITLGEGVRFEFEPNTSFYVSPSASLVAEGTETGRVQPVGTSATGSSWCGLGIESPNDANFLRFVDIANGGACGHDSSDERGGIVLLGEGFVNLGDSSVRDSGACGVNVTTSGARLVEGTENEYSGNTLDVCGPV